MNKDLLKFIETLSKNDKKTLSQKALKTTEEVGELAKAVLPFENASGTLHRFVSRKQILENAVDTMICALSIAYDLGFTDKDIEKMMEEKSEKWSGLQSKEEKAKYPLPFEIHVTIEKREEERDRFVEWCKANDVKPIILDLEKGDDVVMIDYMTSSKHYGDNNTAMETAKSLAKSLTDDGFNVVRVKIETVPWHPAAPRDTIGTDVMPENSYFESHLRIVTTEDRRPMLVQIAKQINAHLSRNYFKKINDSEYIIMMTLRSYNDTYERFKKRVDSLKDALISVDFVIDKTEVEFAVYDSNTEHDLKWIK